MTINLSPDLNLNLLKIKTGDTLYVKAVLCGQDVSPDNLRSYSVAVGGTSIRVWIDGSAIVGHVPLLHPVMVGCKVRFKSLPNSTATYDVKAVELSSAALYSPNDGLFVVPLNMLAVVQ